MLQEWEWAGLVNGGMRGAGGGLEKRVMDGGKEGGNEGQEREGEGSVC